MARNIKRGFNRFFVVLTVMWVVFCTVVFPLNERHKATVQYDKDMVVCYSDELGNGKSALDTCLRDAEAVWKTTLDEYTIKNFYVGAWQLILAAIVALPLLVYGIVRGVAATSVWVWKGFYHGPTR
jgi:hypothetical protein